MCLYLLEKHKDAPCKKFNLFVYVKCHLSLHISARRRTKERNWLQFSFMNLKYASFHDLTIKYFKWNTFLTWQGSFKRLSKERNYLCRLILFISLHLDILVKVWVLNSHTNSTVYFKSVRTVFYGYTKGFKLPLRDKKYKCHWEHFSASRKWYHVG